MNLSNHKSRPRRFNNLPYDIYPDGRIVNRKGHTMRFDYSSCGYPKLHLSGKRYYMTALMREVWPEIDYKPERRK